MRLPKTIKHYQDTFNLDYNNLLSVNPKLKKVRLKHSYYI